jgi:predicted transcriptional regulator
MARISLRIDEGRKRSAAGLLHDILSCLESHGPSRKTRVMFEAAVNTAVFDRYLEKLSRAGLITLSRDGRFTTLAITEAGRSLLRDLECFREERSRYLQVCEDVYEKLKAVVGQEAAPLS